MISRSEIKSCARALRFILLGFLIFTPAACISYSERTIRNTDALQPRDPQTGILIGAEERTIGPADSKSAVLFVHGFIGGGQNFADLPDRLAARGCRVRVIRLPGLGTSPLDFEKVTADEMITKVLGEIRALKSEGRQVFIVTHSMGAAISTLAAAQEPVEGLVWGAPFFGISYRWYYVFPSAWWVNSAGRLVRFVERTDNFIKVECPEARERILAYRWIPLKSARLLVSLGGQASAPAVLSRIECPVLWFHSDFDSAASPDRAAVAFEHLSSSPFKTRVRLDHSEHHIYWDCQREEVVSAVESFIFCPGPSAASPNSMRFPLFSGCVYDFPWRDQ